MRAPQAENRLDTLVGDDGGQILSAVDELPIDLVANEEQAVIPGHLGDHPGLLRRQHHAGGIAGVGNQDGAGPLVDQRLDPLPVGIEVPLLRRGGQGADLAAGGIDKRGIVGIEGLRYDHLVPLVQNAVEDHLQRLAAAGGDENITLLQMGAQPVVVALDRLDQAGDPGRRRILQHRLGKLAHRLEAGRRRGNVGLTDIQMVHLLACCLGRLRIGVELTDGGQAASLDLAGKFHIHFSFSQNAIVSLPCRAHLLILSEWLYYTPSAALLAMVLCKLQTGFLH